MPILEGIIKFQVAKLIHQQLGMKYGQPDKNIPRYYKYQPAPVLESKRNIILYWDWPELTNNSISYTIDLIFFCWTRKKNLSL